MPVTTTRTLFLALTALGLALACESEPDPGTSPAQVEQAASVAPPEPAPMPEPEPEPSAEEPQEVPVPQWVEDYAEALCKRVAVCREKMLGAVPPQQKMMLSMQIPTQEACLKNTRTFKGKPPRADLDDAQKKALKSCLASVPSTACGNVQTGKVPECQTIVDLLAEAKSTKSDKPADTMAE